MKTEQGIKEQIKRVTQSYKHVLDCKLATILINAPRALLQLEAITKLNALYYVIGKKRPRFECDKKQKRR